MADTEGKEARERARAAMARVGARLADGEPPDGDTVGDLAELAARIDARWWGQDHAETFVR